MIFWYRNSILASVVSIVGCAIALEGIGGLSSDEITSVEAAMVIAVGVVLAVIGKKISVNKEKKKADEENRKK